MLYLKNTLGGLSRSLTDSALHTLQGANRWWKVALYVGLFILPGGSIGVLLFAWFENRRSRSAKTPASAKPAGAIALIAAPLKARAAGHHSAIAPASSVCQTRPDAPACRAAAGKQARQTTSDARI
jgi:hypothetical protein